MSSETKRCGGPEEDDGLPGRSQHPWRCDSPENKPARVFGAAEGIETGLAAMEGTGIPVWATVNATLMEYMEIPSEVELLVVFSDKDRPSKEHPKGHGQEAAQKLVERAISMGKQAIAITPSGEILPGEKSLDWMDVLRVHGPHGFPTMPSIRRALPEGRLRHGP